VTSQTSASPTGGRRAQNCAECGTRPAPGQSFCDDCGAVLSWTPGSANEPSEPTQPQGGSTSGDDPRPDDSAHTPESGPTRRPAVVSADDDTLGIDPVPPTAEPTDERARALLVPVADPNRAPAPAPDVAPVLPGRPAAARPRVQATTVDPDEEGGTPCPWCNTGNRPDRHFCRRCAMSMSNRPDDPEIRLPWWRRVLDPRNRPAPWAGDRPRLRRNLGHIVSWVGWGLVIALVVTAIFYVDNGYNATRDHFAKRTPVAPDSFKASRSFGGHDAALAFDKMNNTWWGPGVSQGGEGEWIEATFQRPTRLLDVLITPGISTKPADLSKSAFPHRVEARITLATGKTITRNLTLDQAMGAQRRKFRVGEVSAVRFTLVSAHGIAADKQVSIAEIEFFGRSTSDGS
jgi:hypothetical protein